jgi:hypothetical protein
MPQTTQNMESRTKIVECHTNYADALNICSLITSSRILGLVNSKLINEKYALCAYRLGTCMRICVRVCVCVCCTYLNRNSDLSFLVLKKVISFISFRILLFVFFFSQYSQVISKTLFLILF